MAANLSVPFNYTVFTVPLSCEYVGSSVTSNGVFRKGNPLHKPLSLLLVQLGVAILLLATIKRILRPLKQPRFVAEMLTGIILGPSMLQLIGKGEFYLSLFTNKQQNVMGVLDLFSFATFSFVVGVRTDISVIKAAGKLSWIIGTAIFVVPLTLSVTTVNRIGKTDPMAGAFLHWISILAASTSFQVTSFLLEDLKLLNSEIGRLAMSCALVSSLGSWVFMIYNSFFKWASFLQFGPMDYIKTEVPRFICILIIIFILRPFMLWLIRKSPERRNVKESHFFVVMLMFFIVVFGCEYMGYKAYFGAMIFGLAVPSGPPLGSGIVDRLQLFISSVLLPAYIIDAGRFVDVFSISMKSFTLTEFIITLCVLGKIASAVIPAMLWRIPYKDSFSLGLILSSQGFFDILVYKLYLRFTLISPEYYTVITVMTAVNAAIVTPLIHYLYDPSKRYVNYKRRTIQQSTHESAFRIVVCVHEEDQVYSLMNILEASHPTRDRPIGAFILDLMELVGRDNPVLINHQFHKLRSTATRTDRIVSAFHQYERRSDGAIRSQQYTTITPYSTMHDDICTLALEKSASLLIIPFHKSESSAIRGVTKNVLDKAPCSVGILVDKKIIMHWRSESVNHVRFHVCVVFVGGPDSREALAYGMRMVENPATKLTVIRLIAEDEFITDLVETKLDIKAITDLRGIYEDNHSIEYKELVVKDGAETSRALLSLDDDYDFILVGRRLDSESPLVSGLADWSYVQELGIIGDMLASSDLKSKASVLVLQQQSTVEDMFQKL